MSILTGVVIVVAMATLAQRSDSLIALFGDAQPPEARRDQISIEVGERRLIDVAANDLHVTPEHLETLRIAVAPACGAAEVDEGAILYIANESCIGALQLLSYCYGGPETCDPAPVTIAVAPAPQRRPAPATTPEGQEIASRLPPLPDFAGDAAAAPAPDGATGEVVASAPLGAWPVGDGPLGDGQAAAPAASAPAPAPVRRAPDVAAAPAISGPGPYAALTAPPALIRNVFPADPGPSFRIAGLPDRRILRALEPATPARPVAPARPVVAGPDPEGPPPQVAEIAREEDSGEAGAPMVSLMEIAPPRSADPSIGASASIAAPAPEFAPGPGPFGASDPIAIAPRAPEAEPRRAGFDLAALSFGAEAPAGAAALRSPAFSGGEPGAGPAAPIPVISGHDAASAAIAEAARITPAPFFDDQLERAGDAPGAAPTLTRLALDAAVGAPPPGLDLPSIGSVSEVPPARLAEGVDEGVDEEVEVAALTPAAAPCAPVKLNVSAMSSAMMRVDVQESCLAGGAAEIRHAGLAFAFSIDGDGRGSVTFPVMSPRAGAEFRAAGVAPVVIPVQAKDLNEVQRVAISWSDPVDLDLHAFEYAARFGGDGHVWSGAPGNERIARRRGGGYLNSYPAIGPSGMGVEVYTFWEPRDGRPGVTQLALDYVSRGEVATGDYCSEGALAAPAFNIMRAEFGRTSQASGVLAPVECGAELRDGRRYISNAVRDLTVARR